MVLAGTVVSPVSPVEGRFMYWTIPLFMTAFGLYKLLKFAPYPIPSDNIRQLLQHAKRSYRGRHEMGIVFDAAALPSSTIEKIRKHLPGKDDSQLGEVHFRTRDGHIIYQVSVGDISIRCNDDLEDTELLIRTIIEHTKASRRLI